MPRSEEPGRVRNQRSGSAFLSEDIANRFAQRQPGCLRQRPWRCLQFAGIVLVDGFQGNPQLATFLDEGGRFGLVVPGHFGVGCALCHGR